MNPYVTFQEHLITWLESLANRFPDTLLELATVCRSPAVEFIDWPKLLISYGFAYENEPFKPHQYREYKLSEVILEQIDDSGEQVKIRNLLGMPLSRYGDQTTEFPDEWRSNPSSLLLRSSTFSQVRALNPGDILISGEKVLHPPREGGNGIVLVCLSEAEQRNLWLEYPGRTVLALALAHGEGKTSHADDIAIAP